MASSQTRRKSRVFQSLTGASITVVRHIRRHIGLGLVCSIAYFDPGNWGVDLQAGTFYGYRLLFMVWLAGLAAAILQMLAVRLGCVTGLDLASHCRLLLRSHPKYPRLVRFLVLYPLYLISEVAIISTDLAELLGSAMALCMLFPNLEIWEGILITAADVLFLLALKDPLHGRPVRAFELFMAILTLAVMICLVIIIAQVEVNWRLAFQGYLPSKYIFPNGAFYTSVGILGATVMPHSLFLGSVLATQEREKSDSYHSTATEQAVPEEPISCPSNGKNQGFGNPLIMLRRSVRPLWLFVAQASKNPPKSLCASESTCHKDRQNNSFDFVKRHLYHGIVDVVGSLLGFAVIINSMILVVSGAVFFYGDGTGQIQTAAGLFDAYNLIQTFVGKGAAKLFAVALLAAGQSSSIVATVAGQAVAEGFLRWRVSAVIRRLFTRIIAIVPAMAVAIALGRPGINALLVASQVVLSITLPFIMLPLLYFTSSKKFMTVKKPRSIVDNANKPVGEDARIPRADGCNPSPVGDVEASPQSFDLVDFSNGRFTTLIACALWLLVTAANIYVLVTIGTGDA